MIDEQMTDEERLKKVNRELRMETLKLIKNVVVLVGQVVFMMLEFVFIVFVGISAFFVGIFRGAKGGRR